MLSLDDSNAQPSTPCSASIECGGRRSTLTPLVAGDFCRRAFCKSGGGPLASVSRESIMQETRHKNLARRKQELFLNNHRLCTRRAGSSVKSARRKTPAGYYSGFLSAFGFFGGRSFFAAALAEAAAPVFAEEASLPFGGAASFVFGAVAGASTGCGTAVPLSTRTFSVVVTSGCKRSSTSCSPSVRSGCSRRIFFLSMAISNWCRSSSAIVPAVIEPNSLPSSPAFTLRTSVIFERALASSLMVLNSWASRWARRWRSASRRRLLPPSTESQGPVEKDSCARNRRRPSPGRTRRQDQSPDE